MGLTLEDRGIVQVSMNLTNYEKTPIFRVFELVKREAARYGVPVLESEIVGLVPAAALVAAAECYLQLEGFTADQVLENKLAMSGVDAEAGRLVAMSSPAFSPDSGRPMRRLFPRPSTRPPRRRDAERPHLPIQVAALDAEHVGGARHVALLRGQRAEDVVALEALARLVQRQRAAPRRLRRPAPTPRRGPGTRGRPRG